MNNWKSSLNRRRFLSLSAVGGGLAAFPLTLPSGAGAEATPVAASLHSAVTETMTAHAIPGANVLVERPDRETWTAGFGVGDLKRETAMDPAMHMRIGSITKTMTATVILQLIDAGALTLEDTVAHLLPEMTGLQYADHITIGQLLGMTSGIFDLLDDTSFLVRVLSDPTREWTPEEMIDIALMHDPLFAPGADFAYSNTNYLLLGMIIERLTDSSIATELDQRIFTPLGMAGTSLPQSPVPPSPYAHGYGFIPTIPSAKTGTPSTGQATPAAMKRDGPSDLTLLSPSVGGAAGGVVSTVGDLHIWLRELIDGSLVSDELQRERMTFRPVKRDPGEPSYSYGLGIANYDGLIGHDGDIVGYQSIMGRLAETGESIIVLANLSPTQDGTDAADAIAQAIRDALASTPAASPIAIATP